MLPIEFVALAIVAISLIVVSILPDRFYQWVSDKDIL